MIDILAKLTAVLLLALIADALFRRSPAALLHRLWTGAIICALILPFVHLPQRAEANTIYVLAAAPLEAAPISQAPASIPLATLPGILFACWTAGAVLVALRAAFGLFQIWRITRAASPLPTPTAPVPIVLSSAIPVPMTWGVRRPVILLPTGASEWPDSRLRSAIAHEVAHIERRDWLVQMFALAVCSVYWFHPLAWLAARRLSSHAEHACDDRVLLSGTTPADYAADLVEIARDARTSSAAALAMSAHDLEARVCSLLDDHRARRSPGRLALALASLAAVLCLAPLAAIRLAAQPGPGRLAGTVQDASGAMVPGASVGAENLDGDNQEAAVSDDAGHFRFAGLPAGRYRITIQARGFKPFHSSPITVGAGEASLAATLQLGGVFEQVQVTAPRSSPLPPRTPLRIRVGGNVQATRLLQRVNPAYPAHAAAAGVEGTVLLNAVIGTDGVPRSLTVLSKSADSELVAAAQDAVSRWLYQPVLLNGVPVEVVTTVAVTFRLN
ncbi:MAG: TonB family protein [Acidobacteria bacterium]|nr:TonB family protein [Acidobacteriota bacterium]